MLKYLFVFLVLMLFMKKFYLIGKTLLHQLVRFPNSNSPLISIVFATIAIGNLVLALLQLIPVQHWVQDVIIGMFGKVFSRQLICFKGLWSYLLYLFQLFSLHHFLIPKRLRLNQLKKHLQLRKVAMMLELIETITTFWIHI